MSENLCPNQGADLQKYHLAACDAVIEAVERAEEYYRANDAVDAAVRLIRRRAAEPGRPTIELDYIDRLLRRF